MYYLRLEGNRGNSTNLSRRWRTLIVNTVCITGEIVSHNTRAKRTLTHLMKDGYAMYSWLLENEWMNDSFRKGSVVVKAGHCRKSPIVGVNYQLTSIRCGTHAAELVAVNLLWPGEVLWCRKSWSIMVQVMPVTWQYQAIAWTDSDLFINKPSTHANLLPCWSRSTEYLLCNPTLHGV